MHPSGVSLDDFSLLQTSPAPHNAPESSELSFSNDSRTRRSSSYGSAQLENDSFFSHEVDLSQNAGSFPSFVSEGLF